MREESNENHPVLVVTERFVLLRFPSDLFAERATSNGLVCVIKRHLVAEPISLYFFVVILMKRFSVLILLGILATVAAAASNAPLAVINDDYDKARAEAVARRVPIFVEVWAPW